MSLQLPRFTDAAEALAWLGGASAQAAALIIAILALRAALGHRLTPGWRLALWMIVLLRLVVPLAVESRWSLAAIARRVPSIATRADVAIATAKPPAASGGPRVSVAYGPVPGDATPIVAPRVAIVTPTPVRWTTREAFVVAWLSGVAAMLLREATGALRLARAIRRMRPIDDAALLALAARCARDVGVRQRVRLVETDRLRAPAVCGIVRPTILLPVDVSRTLSPAELRLVLLHEFVHVRRDDALVGAIARLVRAMHWFNPFVWLAAAAFRADRELAADAAVLRVVGDAERHAYGDCLLHVVARVSGTPLHAATLGLFGPSRHLQRRIDMIAVQPTRSRTAGVARAVTGAGIVAAIGFSAVTGEAQIATSRPATTTTTTVRPARADNDPLAAQIIQRRDAAARADALTRARSMLEGSPAERVAALGALRATGAQVKFDRAPFADAIRANLSHADAAVRAAALGAMFVFGEPADVDRIVALADDAAPLVRAEVPGAMRFAGKPNDASAAFDAVELKLLADGDARVRLEALRSAWGVAVSPAVEARMIEMSRDPQTRHNAIYFGLSTRPVVRRAVAERLAEITNEPDLSGDVQRIAWGLNKDAEPDARPIVDAIQLGLLGDSVDPNVRRSCVLGLSRSPDPAARAKLRAIADDPTEDEQLRRDAGNGAAWAAERAKPVAAKGGTRALNDTILPEVHFDNLLLADAIDSLKESTRVALDIDWASIERAGGTRMILVTANMKNASLNSVLITLCKSADDAKLHLGIVMRDGVATMAARDAEDGTAVSTRTYDVRDLLIEIPDFQAPAATQPAATRPTRDERSRQLIDVIQSTIESDSWKSNGGLIGAIQELSGQLIVTTTPAIHTRIESLLVQLRNGRAIQVNVEARFVAADPARLTDLLGDRAATIGDAKKMDSVFIDDAAATSFLRAVRLGEDAETLTAPKVTLFNGQRVFVKVARPQAYIADFTLTQTAAGERRFEPRLQEAESGITLEMEAVVSADHKYVTLTLKPQLSRLVRLESEPFAGDPKSGLSVQRPTIETQEMRTTVSVPDRGTLLLSIGQMSGGSPFGGMPFARAGAPLLATTRDAPRQLLLMVRPTVIVQREVDPTTFPPAK